MVAPDARRGRHGCGTRRWDEGQRDFASGCGGPGARGIVGTARRDRGEGRSKGGGAQSTSQTQHNPHPTAAATPTPRPNTPRPPTLLRQTPDRGTPCSPDAPTRGPSTHRPHPSPPHPPYPPQPPTAIVAWSPTPQPPTTPPTQSLTPRATIRPPNQTSSPPALPAHPRRRLEPRIAEKTRWPTELPHVGPQFVRSPRAKIPTARGHPARGARPCHQPRTPAEVCNVTRV